MRFALSPALPLVGLIAYTIPVASYGGNMGLSIHSVTASYIGAGWTPRKVIDEQTWLRTQRCGRFVVIGSDRPAIQQTDVRVCYDRVALYVRFDCFEDRMDSVVANFKNDGDPIWQDDSVELWISPYAVASRDKTYQFVVNVNGIKTCLKADSTPHNCEWYVKTIRMPDRWIAIFTIPYSALQPIGRNEDCWRILFGRNENPHSETSSWPAVPQFFATYSRFARLVPSSTLFKFNTFRGQLRPVKAPGDSPSGLQSIDDFPVRSALKEPLVIPRPREMYVRSDEDAFRIGKDTCVVVSSDAGTGDLWSVEELNDALDQLGGPRLQIVHDFAVSKDPAVINNTIVIGEVPRNKLLQVLCESDKLYLPTSKFGTRGYILDVSAKRIIVAGETPVETFYAVQTLRQLIQRGADGELSVPSVLIRDYPRFSFRGVHLLSSRDALQYIGKLIERVLAPFKINHIVLQTDKVAWKSHPEVVDPSNYMPAEDVRKLVEIAKRHHIAVTPLVQSPGHLEWAFRDKRNLEFAEDPDKPYSYCMSNPKSYEFIFSIMDEAIEIFGNPEFFHAGRDEFDMRGKMPRDEKCSAIGKERLYIQDTLRVYEYLKSKGCKMMMWGDVLVRPGFRELIDELPRDIIINDWHYAPTENYPTVDFYVSNGFPVIGCTWYDPRNIARFSRYASERNALGMMQTTWTGFEVEEVVLKKWPEQVYGYVLSAAWSWNPADADLGLVPYRADVVFKKAWGELPSSAESGKYAVVRLDRYCNVSRVDSGKKVGWLGVGRGFDFRELPAGVVEIEGAPYYVLPANVRNPAVLMLGGTGIARDLHSAVKGISVNGYVKALRFLHGCGYGVESGIQVGRYIIHFEDGTSETVELVLGNNIFAWDDQSTAATYGHAWKTVLKDGRIVGVGTLRWENRRPNVKVVSIDFIADLPEVCPFLIALTAEV